MTKPEIETIRGVSCNEVVNTLLEKNLVTIAGRSDTIGKPLLYGTTDEFLRAFGLHDISDLPKPRELEELMERRADILNVDTVVFAEDENVADFEERLPHHIRSEEQPPGTQTDDSSASPVEPDATSPEAEVIQPPDVTERAAPGISLEEPVETVEPEQQEGKQEQAVEISSEQREEESSEQNGEEQTQHRERKMRAVMSVNGR